MTTCVTLGDFPVLVLDTCHRLCKLLTTVSQSTLRTLVDEALEKRDTTLTQFVKDGQSNGLSIDALTANLAYVTGIPVSSRTIYRWTRP